MSKPLPTPQTSSPPATSRRGRRLRMWAGSLVIVLVCLAVFAQYLRPGMTVDLANRLWSCF